MFVDAFVVRQIAAHFDGGVHGLADNFVHGQHDQAVVQQQHIVCFDFVGQVFVIQTHSVLVAQLGAGGVQNEFSADFQHDFVVHKTADADFGTLQVGHDADHGAGAGRCFTHHFCAVAMVLGRTVAEVQAHNVDASAYHLLQNGWVAGGGA